MSNFNFQKPIPDLVEQISQLSNFYQNKNNYGASTNDGFHEKKLTSSTAFEIGDNDLTFKSIKIL